ncbi:hypothetical protein ACFSS8_10670 [Paracoccus kondratievae]
MPALETLIERKLQQLPVPLAVRLPSGRRLGPQDARVTIAFQDVTSLALLASAKLGRLGDEIVRGRARIEGSMRDLMRVVAALIPQEGQMIAPTPGSG